MRLLHPIVLGVLLGYFTACEDPSDPPAPPSMEDIADLTARKCEQEQACYEENLDDAELAQICESWGEVFERVLSETNSECADLWLVYEYNECRTNLGCSDYTMTDPESPGSPCHDELMAVYDAKCQYI